LMPSEEALKPKAKQQFEEFISDVKIKVLL
jgi:hypothetical protein